MSKKFDWKAFLLVLGGAVMVGIGFLSQTTNPKKTSPHSNYRPRNIEFEHLPILAESPGVEIRNLTDNSGIDGMVSRTTSLFVSLPEGGWIDFGANSDREATLSLFGAFVRGPMLGGVRLTFNGRELATIDQTHTSWQTTGQMSLGPIDAKKGRNVLRVQALPQKKKEKNPSGGNIFITLDALRIETALTDSPHEPGAPTQPH